MDDGRLTWAFDVGVGRGRRSWEMVMGMGDGRGRWKTGVGDGRWEMGVGDSDSDGIYTADLCVHSQSRYTMVSTTYIPLLSRAPKATSHPPRIITARRAGAKPCSSPRERQPASRRQKR